MPLYNGVEFLAEAIQSLLSQTFTDWELLIGINGHGADGGQVAQEARAMATDPRISVIVQTVRGKSASLNDLVRRARADWLCLLDCDDKWEPTKLAQQHEARLGPAAEAGVLGTFCRYFGDRDGSPSIPSGYLPHGTTLQVNPIINSSCMLKRKYAYWYGIDSVFGIEDYDLWLRLDTLKVKMYNVPLPLTWHRVHKQSAFNSKHINPTELVKFYRGQSKTVISAGDWFNYSRLPRDLPPNCTVLVDTEMPNGNEPNGTSPLIFIQVEPEIILPQEEYLIKNWHKFERIYTFNQRVFEQCPNARKYVHGTKWLYPFEYEAMIPEKKRFAVSSICGTKYVNGAIGHLLRIKLYEYQQAFTFGPPMTLFRSNQKPLLPEVTSNPLLGDVKVPLFETYQFSIIIENSKQTNYFTEKIMDCILSKTIPIYYGCPNIAEFFDVRGLIVIEAEEAEAALIELHQKIRTLDQEYYNRHFEFVEENYARALKWLDMYENIEVAKLSRTESSRVLQYY